jgi:hypothetical protein
MEVAIAVAVTNDRAKTMRALADHLRAQGDALCEALVATQEDIDKAKAKLNQTEEQLKAAQAMASNAIDEEAQTTLNELFDKLAQAHKKGNFDYKNMEAMAFNVETFVRGEDGKVFKDIQKGNERWCEEYKKAEERLATQEAQEAK